LGSDHGLGLEQHGASTRWRSEPSSNPTSNPKEPPKPTKRWQIESGTRGVYVGGGYAHRAANWPLFSWSPDPARIVRFDDREAAEAELVRVRSFAANARLREVD
jgi:hypothetical protein